MNYDDKLRKEAEARLKETQRLSSSPEALNPVEDKKPDTGQLLKDSVKAQIKGHIQRQFQSLSPASGQTQMPGPKIARGLFIGCVTIAILLVSALSIIPIWLFQQKTFIEDFTRDFDFDFNYEEAMPDFDFNEDMEIEDKNPIKIRRVETTPAFPCPITSIFQDEIDKGTLPKPVVTVSQGKTRYEFDVQGTKFSIEFDENCNIVTIPPGR